MTVSLRADAGYAGLQAAVSAPQTMEVTLDSKAVLIVRAEVAAAADRPPFDTWYETEHLPEAKAAFAADRVWRAWSRVEPSVHYAFYEFSDTPTALAILDSDALKTLVGKFDDAWGARVIRTRDVVEVAQALPAESG